MDQINSNPYFNSARLYQNQHATPKTNSQVDPSSHAAPIQPQSTGKPASNDFSSMFDDDALLKLQGNLEAIAQMAEQSLKRIEG